VGLTSNRKDLEGQYFRSYAEEEEVLRYFRFLDINARRVGDSVKVYVSFQHWDPEERVKTVRLVRHVVSDLDAFLAGEIEVTNEDWEVVKIASPAMEFTQNQNPDAPFRSNRSGGRIVFDSEGNIIWGLGDYSYDGLVNDRFDRLGPDSSMSKIMQIDPSTLEVSILAEGFRNPQGLLVSSSGVVWETEHGPQGGDELNIIEEGNHYGWPIVTYGTHYGSFSWPASETPGRHEGYQKPVFSWVPSVGTSNLIEVQDKPAAWQGDFLIGSLREKTIYRARVDDSRVIYVEPIPLGERIRDLVVMEDGTIVVWADSCRFMELRQMEHDANFGAEIAFDLTEEEEAVGMEDILKTCIVCHGLREGQPSANGPSLVGVFGRKIAGTNFPRHTPALKGRGGEWNEKSLRDFLRDPQRFSPRTTMPQMPFFQDQETLGVMVDFLKKL
jgi:cytochrome c2